jgi:threonine dehydrogenase-like Zn-dependent dehydrogenase
VRAIVFEGTRSVGVRDVPDATLEAGSDALIRLTSSAICGTDLQCTTAARAPSRSTSATATRWSRSVGDLLRQERDRAVRANQ